MMIPAIVVGCYTMGVGVVRSLGRNGVPVVAVHYDRSDMAHRSKYVRERVPAPHPQKSEEDFIDVMVGLGQRFPASPLIPTTDSALAALSRHSESLGAFRRGFPDWGQVSLFMEKYRTYELAERAGIPVPRTVVPRDLLEVVDLAPTLEYPILVKPSQSHLFTARFGRKMIEVHDREELISSYQIARDANLDVVLQEIIPGPDSMGANYNSLAVKGQPIVEFTARQLRNAPPRFGSPRAVVSERIPEVMDVGRAIIGELGFEGFSCVELKYDSRHEHYKLIEVNGRHNLSSELAPRCGIDFPWLHYLQLVEGELPPDLNGDFTEGIYWTDLVRDLVTTLRNRGDEEGLSLREFLRPYRGERVSAIASLSDPLPFIVRVVDMIGRSFRSDWPSREEQPPTVPAYG